MKMAAWETRGWLARTARLALFHGYNVHGLAWGTSEHSEHVLSCIRGEKGHGEGEGGKGGI